MDDAGMNDTPSYKILLVEDDKNISEMVCDFLDGDSYKTDPIYDGREAIRKFQQNTYDLVLLDLTLPNCGGMEVLKNIRKTSIVPVIIVTAKDNDTDKMMGLNLGADDYITKPFSLIELSSRIKANIRRATQYNQVNSSEGSIIKIKDLEINAVQHIVRKKEIILTLTYTEFEILSILAASPGQAFSKEQLYDLVWKEPYYGNEHVLNTHMNRLRNKLRTGSPTGGEYIKTLWGIGYKMEDN